MNKKKWKRQLVFLERKLKRLNNLGGWIKVSGDYKRLELQRKQIQALLLDRPGPLTPLIANNRRIEELNFQRNL